MAHVLFRESQLEHALRASKQKALKLYGSLFGFIFVSAAGAIVSNALHASYLVIGTFIGLLAVAGIILIVLAYQEGERDLAFLLIKLVKKMFVGDEILKSGAKGESETLNILRELPDKYTVMNDVNVTTSSGAAQMDFLVIATHGLWIIETKNLNGAISGTTSSQNWIQRKVGRAGGEYEKSFYNPIKQVSTHVYRLREYLNTRGISPLPWVQGIVLFTNDRVSLNVETDNDHPVLHGKQAVLDYFLQTEHQAKSILSPATIDTIADCLQ